MWTWELDSFISFRMLLQSTFCFIVEICSINNFYYFDKLNLGRFYFMIIYCCALKNTKSI